MLFFFKQKTAYEMRISDWSSDVCSSDLDSRLRWQDCAVTWPTPKKARPKVTFASIIWPSASNASSGGSIWAMRPKPAAGRLLVSPAWDVHDRLVFCKPVISPVDAAMRYRIRQIVKASCRERVGQYV